MIIDYSRRTDPACIEGVNVLKNKIKKYGYPALVHFWTKAPAVLFDLYNDVIADLKKNNVVVCIQITLNNYGLPLEKVTEDMQRLDKLVGLLGSKAVRLRFDPIIIGYTCMAHYKKIIETAEKYDIKRITVNFLEPKYKGVGELLKKQNIEVVAGGLEKKINILNKLRDVTAEKIELAVCAESATLLKYVDGYEKASCADLVWFKDLGLKNQNIKGHFSRRGCGCYYTDDWGVYPTKNGYVCPHKCLYCYAKHNLYGLN
jgi:DNA repair photolyase